MKAPKMQTSPNTQQLRNSNQQKQQTDKWEQIRGRLEPHSYICVHSAWPLEAACTAVTLNISPRMAMCACSATWRPSTLLFQFMMRRLDYLVESRDV